jgi:hypothetical protein
MEQEGVVSLIENRALTPDEIGLLASLIAAEPDHYTVLGVNRNASNEEVQAAYCLAVEYFHPAKSRKITESDSVMHWKLSSAFLRIEEAFTVLSSRSRRTIYNDTLNDQRAAGVPRPQLQQIPDSRQQSRDGQSGVSRTPSSEFRCVTDEMRRVERVLLNLPLRVSFDRHWQELTETTDVSPLGVRFRLVRPVEPGSELRLELPMPKHLRTHSYDDELYIVKAFVIYAANHESGRQVVAEFI